MSSIVVGLGAIVGLLALLLLGLPVAFSLALTGALGLLALGGPQPVLGLLSTVPYSAVASFALIVLPMFVLMGELVVAAGIAQNAYSAARLWLGRLPGGLAMTAIGASTYFAAVSGSSVAATATVGRLSIAEMRRYGYDAGLAAGTVLVAGTLAALIPPSAMMVFYALVTDQSVAKMLMAGLGPGLLSAALFMATAYLVAKRSPHLAPVLGERVSWGERLASLRTTGWLGVLVVLILAGIYTGVVTVTEASALGALVAFVLLTLSGRLTWPSLRDALSSSVRVSGMIFLIIIGGLLFSRFLAFSGIPFEMVKLIQSLDISPVTVVVIMLLIMTVLGMFIDPVGMIMLTVPFFFPIVKALGIDPIWFGVLVVLQAELGVITPPVGIHLFVVKQIAPDVSLLAIVRGALPFMVCQLIVIALVVAFPQIALWVPGRM